MIHIYHGDGKGKTTAAIGLLTRARGAHLAAGVMFFDKGGTHYAERSPLTTLGVTVAATGRDRIDPTTKQFDFSLTDVDRMEAIRGLTLAREWLTSKKYAVIVLDEVLNCVRLGMLDVADVKATIEPYRETCEIILTGRGLPPELADSADLITETHAQRHYFTRGIVAREGIDY